jgi:methenyltetrahydromethanopterin cyclohydrolase (EC 3.5.4.27)
MEPLNRLATELIDEAIDFADELAIDVYTLEGDAAVVDFGVDVPGATEAGLLLAEIQTAGLATIQTAVADAGGRPRTHVELSTDHPALALLCASKGGWELSVDGFEGLGAAQLERCRRRVGLRADGLPRGCRLRGVSCRDRPAARRCRCSTCR